ncbi:MAG: exopolysaccharide transport family protein [bacterium]
MDVQSSNAISLRDIFNVIRRRKWLILICLSGFLIPVLVYNHKAVPIYRSSTKVKFEQSKDIMAFSPFGGMNNTSDIQNIIEEMKTKSFAEDVYADLDGAIVARCSNLSLYSPEYDLEKFVVSHIKVGLSSSPIRGTEIINIYYDTEDPELAQIVAQTTADVLIKRNIREKTEKLRKVLKSIDAQLGKVEKRLENSENELKIFKETNKITSIEGETREILRKKTEIENLLNQVKISQKELHERQAIIKIKLDSANTALIKATGISYRQKINQLRNNLGEIENRISSLRLQGVPENNAKMIESVNEREQILAELKLIAEMHKNLDDPINKIIEYQNKLDALEIDLQALNAKKNKLESLENNYINKLNNLPWIEKKLVQLIREVEINNNLYINLLEKRDEARINLESVKSNIRVIEPARYPGIPIRPRKILNIFIGIFSGLFFGVFLIFVFEYFNNEIRTQEDIENELGIPVIAVIPKNRTGLNGIFNLNSNGEMFAGTKYDSIFFDAYNLLSFALENQPHQGSTIMVTSCVPDEGKSTVASMLALTSAQRGKKTLLIDADLRRPSLHSFFHVPREPGLTNMVVEMMQLQNRITHSSNNNHNNVHFNPHRHHTPPVRIVDDHIAGATLIEELLQRLDKNLYFLPCGFIPNNPVRIWSSRVWNSMFQHLSSCVDLIIIDAPPIIGVAETTMMAMYVEHILFCVAAGGVDKKTIKRAFKTFRESIPDAENKIIGAVLNKADLANTYGSYKYYRYYSKSDKLRLTPELPKIDFTHK